MTTFIFGQELKHSLCVLNSCADIFDEIQVPFVQGVHKLKPVYYNRVQFLKLTLETCDTCSRWEWSRLDPPYHNYPFRQQT